MMSLCSPKTPVQVRAVHEGHQTQLTTEPKKKINNNNNNNKYINKNPKKQGLLIFELINIALYLCYVYAMDNTK